MAMGVGNCHYHTWMPRPSVLAFVEAHLEGCRIPAFSMGGELFLCLPQVIGRVLPGVSLADIQLRCDRLSIVCRRCTQEQEALLRWNGDLDAASSCKWKCGLIRQTDAERLCKNLLAPRLALLSTWLTGEEAEGERVAVRHECFGKQRGTLLPQLFNWPGAPCIVCTGCSCLLSPAQFVGHSHGSQEVAATCHWGFDSAKWRLYLHLDWRRADPSGAAMLEMVKATIWLYDFAPKSTKKDETVQRQVQGESIRTPEGFFDGNTSSAKLQSHLWPQPPFGSSSDTVTWHGSNKSLSHNEESDTSKRPIHS